MEVGEQVLEAADLIHTHLLGHLLGHLGHLLGHLGHLLGLLGHLLGHLGHLLGHLGHLLGLLGHPFHCVGHGVLFEAADLPYIRLLLHRVGTEIHLLLLHRDILHLDLLHQRNPLLHGCLGGGCQEDLCPRLLAALCHGGEGGLLGQPRVGRVVLHLRVAARPRPAPAPAQGVLQRCQHCQHCHRVHTVIMTH